MTARCHRNNGDDKHDRGTNSGVALHGNDSSMGQRFHIKAAAVPEVMKRRDSRHDAPDLIVAGVTR